MSIVTGLTDILIGLCSIVRARSPRTQIGLGMTSLAAVLLGLRLRLIYILYLCVCVRLNEAQIKVLA